MSDFVLRPGRTLDIGVEVGPGNYTIRVEADTAVAVGVGETGIPKRSHTLEGYAKKRSRRVLTIQNVCAKSKARGAYEVSGG